MPAFINHVRYVSYFRELLVSLIAYDREILPQFRRLQHQVSTLGASVNPALHASNHIAENISFGLTILVIGLFKKGIIADSLAAHTTPVFQTPDWVSS